MFRLETQPIFLILWAKTTFAVSQSKQVTRMEVACSWLERGGSAPPPPSPAILPVNYCTSSLLSG